jgi:photosystem II stability/assembly factor-like uncharacterized protein
MEGPYGGSISYLVQNEFYQFASTRNGVYKSSDHGRTWERLLIGIGPSYSSNYIGLYQNQIVVYGESSISGEKKGYLMKSNDNGNSWIQINKPESDNNIYNIAINAYGIYICDNKHLWASTDQGITWNYSSLNAGRGLIQYNGQIYISVYQKIFKSSSDADEWSEIEVDGIYSAINTFQVFDSILLVRNDYSTLYISDDGGESWTRSFTPSSWGAQVNFIKINDVFYGYRYGSILKSENNGLTWDSTSTVTGIRNMIVADDTIIAGTYGSGILRSGDLGISFKPFNLSLDASDVDAIEVDQDYLWAGCSFNGVSRHKIFTNAWDTILFPAPSTLQDIHILDGRIFVIKDRYDIFRSEDDGTSWSSITPRVNGPPFSKLYSDGHVIMAGGPNGSTYSNLFISFDYGSTWQPDTFRINNNAYWPSMFTRKGSTVFTADSDRIFRSLNNGLSWEKLSDEYTPSNCTCFIKNIKASNDLIFVTLQDVKVSSYMTYLSRDNGDTWEFLETGFPMEDNYDGFEFETEVNDILIATGSWPKYGIYISRDQAGTWQHFDGGLVNENIKEIISDDEYLYAATSGKGVWRRKIEDLITSSTKSTHSTNVITIFPNPSNGSFTMRLDSKSTGKATLLIYDVNGKRCFTQDIILEEESVVTTESLPSGIYFVQVYSEEVTFSSKIIIQK